MIDHNNVGRGEPFVIDVQGIDAGQAGFAPVRFGRLGDQPPLEEIT